MFSQNEWYSSNSHIANQHLKDLWCKAQNKNLYYQIVALVGTKICMVHGTDHYTKDLKVVKQKSEIYVGQKSHNNISVSAKVNNRTKDMRFKSIGD